MRRNAESLLVIAGLQAPRRWRQPVPIREVARAAAAESEQFERVDLGWFPVVALGGEAVGPIIHLLAELIDNAVRFSPPDTTVGLSAALEGDELVLAVVDSGVGMAPSAVEVANQQLANSVDTDGTPAAHLGLYVVGRLAAGLGVEVRLESTPGDGVTASVRVPANLVEGAPTSPVAGVGASPGGAGQRRPAAAVDAALTAGGPGAITAGASPGGGGAGDRTPRPRVEREAANGQGRIPTLRTADAGADRAGASPQPPQSPSSGDHGPGNGDVTASGFRRRQRRNAGGPARTGGSDGPERTPSRLHTPDPASAEQRRARLDRFSAGKATAEEVIALGEADDVGDLDPPAHHERPNGDERRRAADTPE
jgi:anti-sigma regulatory factor (Ser/Thr protein kinase)